MLKTEAINKPLRSRHLEGKTKLSAVQNIPELGVVDPQAVFTPVNPLRALELSRPVNVTLAAQVGSVSPDQPMRDELGVTPALPGEGGGLNLLAGLVSSTGVAVDAAQPACPIPEHVYLLHVDNTAPPEPDSS